MSFISNMMFLALITNMSISGNTLRIEETSSNTGAIPVNNDKLWLLTSPADISCGPILQHFTLQITEGTLLSAIYATILKRMMVLYVWRATLNMKWRTARREVQLSRQFTLYIIDVQDMIQILKRKSVHLLLNYWWN